MFNSTKIKTIKAREILDSRGNPTLEVMAVLRSGISSVASVPSGASTGSHEAYELRDGDKKRYGGRGVLEAVKNVHERIAKVLSGVKVTDQENIDKRMIELDGTENKKNLGANATLGVSLACARAGATALGIPLYRYIHKIYHLSFIIYHLPTPMFNIFNGGKHADTNLDFQEFMLVPLKKVKFSEKVRIGAEIFHTLGKVLLANNLDTDVGNEGGYAPDIDSSVEALEYTIEAIEKAGYAPGQDVGIGVDVGASELYNKSKKKYVFKLDDCELTSEQLITLYEDWIAKYPIVSIEDGLAEDDWPGWELMTRELIFHESNKALKHPSALLGTGESNKAKEQRDLKISKSKIQIVPNQIQNPNFKKLLLIGDDLFTTNVKRLKKGVDSKVANAILIKPNQVGTLSETIDCIKLAQDSNYKVIVSHRSGETGDDFIADLAVAVNADFIKAGSLSRGERVVKYNRLMAIEDELRCKG